MTGENTEIWVVWAYKILDYITNSHQIFFLLHP